MSGLAVLLATSVVPLTWPSSVATAAPGAVSTAVACRADMPRIRHVVLFEPGTSGSAARSEITAACGTLTGYYPEIAVAVATSADSTFAGRLGPDRAYSAQAEAFTGTQRPTRPRLPVGVQSIGPPLTRASESEAGSGTAAGTDRSREQWNLSMIDAWQAQQHQRGSDSVLVGVLDSGIDASHPDLAAAVDQNASAGCVSGVPDQRPQAWQASGQHGTHVAGIIAAADDGAGVTGVAPGVRIASVKVVDSAGFIYPEYAVCGFMWAARRGMRVTNSSYFVDPWLFTCSTEPGQSVVHTAVRRAVAFATSRGVLAVAAAGNENLDLATTTADGSSPNNARTRHSRPVDGHCDVLPAELPDVLAVSAVGAATVKSSYSSYGAGVVDVAAPGGDARQRSRVATSGCVLSTVPGGGYERMCGTSMATPHVAAVAALVASQHPDAGPAELASIVRASATPLTCPTGRYDPDSNGRADAVCASSGPTTTSEPGTTGFYGAGLVNALAAVTR